LGDQNFAFICSKEVQKQEKIGRNVKKKKEEKCSCVTSAWGMTRGFGFQVIWTKSQIMTDSYGSMDHASTNGTSMTETNDGLNDLALIEWRICIWLRKDNHFFIRIWRVKFEFFLI
jgi:hypothetical protein